MTKKKNETQTEVNPSVCYIRVGEYCACYYKTKYDGEPIVFSDNDPLSMIVEENICSNPGLKLLTKHSYSWMAYHYNHEGQIFDVNVVRPILTSTMTSSGYSFLKSCIVVASNRRHHPTGNSPR